MPVDLFTLARHGLACVLLFLSWRYLSNWYLYWGRSDYLIFSGLYLGAVLLAVWPKLRLLMSRIPISRLLPVLAFLLLFLPWGEWLRLNVSTAREDWSRQIYLQTCFVYFFFLFFGLFPAIPKWIREKTQALLDLRSLFWLPCVFFFVFSSWIALFIFQKTPIAQDSAAHLFQAKIFASGELYAPQPPDADFFSIEGDMLVMKDGRWFSMYPPGFPALLSTWMLFGAEWLLSPLLGALTVAIWMAYARRWHHPRIALLLGWMLALSPFLIIMSAAVMVHTPELFLASAVIYLCRRDLESPSKLRSAGLFLALFAAVPTRGFSLLPYLSPVLAYTCWSKFKSRSWLLPLSVVAGIATGIAAMAWYQWQTTGHPLKPAYNLEAPHDFGFGETMFGVHTPARAVENVSNNLLGLNSWLTGWHSGIVVFLVVFFLFRFRRDVWDTILLLCCCTLAGLYFFYLFQDLVFGPRFYYLFAPIFLLFIARSVAVETDRYGKKETFTTALLVFSILIFLPFKLPSFVERQGITGRQAGKIKEAIHAVGNEKSLILLDQNSYQTYVNWNEPFLKAPAIICRDLDTRNPEIMARFPDHRPLYFRKHVDLIVGKQVQTDYKLYDTPDPEPAGFVSLLDLALSLQLISENLDIDVFDVCYYKLFTSPEAALQLEYLDNEIHKKTKDSEYKINFRLGIIHAGRMILLPKAAFEEKQNNWAQVFDPNAFRAAYESAISFLSRSRESGVTISAQLDKVARRIDQNKDKKLSDDEIRNYLQGKVAYLQTGL